MSIVRQTLMSLVPAIFVIGVPVPAQAWTIWYVDDDAPGGAGTSWATAFNDLQDALAAASSGDTIRVAQGRYTPAGPAGSRDATFQLKSGLEIYGGYAGVTEPNPNLRNVQLYETTLSGDLNGDDGPWFKNIDENSYHVVTASAVDSTAKLDGLTIAGGNADGSSAYDRKGGGMLLDSGTPALGNCTFTRNQAKEHGGGLSSTNSPATLIHCAFTYNTSYASGGACQFRDRSATLSDCTFIGNSAEFIGGAIYNIRSSPTLDNCIFISNWAVDSGGAVYNFGRSSPRFNNCSFTRNLALAKPGFWSGGGAVYNQLKCNPIFINCVFIENWATGAGPEDGGGVMYSVESCDPVLINCTAATNWAAKRGGGLYNSRTWRAQYGPSDPVLTNCILWRNRDAGGGGGEMAQVYSDAVCTPVLNYCSIEG